MAETGINIGGTTDVGPDTSVSEILYTAGVAVGDADGYYNISAYVMEGDAARTARDLIFASSSKFYPQAYQELSELIWHCMGYRTATTGGLYSNSNKYKTAIAVDLNGTTYVDHNGLKTLDEFKNALAGDGVDISKFELYSWSVPDKYIK